MLFAVIAGVLYPAFLRGKYVFGDYVSSWIRHLEFSSGDAVVGGLQNFASSAAWGEGRLAEVGRLKSL